ncbi:SRPBCC family protein [Nonomuraea sp. NPDC049709]|uniref:SRPBCC family protein n=1 Tax=Nonomuraea sp. NPDC049709 TaxID=3154736 RepID=UPI0034381DCD
MPRSLFRLAAGAAAGYLFAVRPWHLRWGADDREAHAEMPGDDIVRHAQYQATRAITIDAPPAAVWAWVIQLGGYRPGGTFDRPAGQEAEQGLKVGDVLHGAADGSGYVVEQINPPHTLVLALRGTDATTSCSISLRDLEDGRTRMIFRLRIRAQPNLRGTGYLAMMDVGDFVTMRRQMLTIKERAESAR